MFGAGVAGAGGYPTVIQRGWPDAMGERGVLGAARATADCAPVPTGVFGALGGVLGATWIGANCARMLARMFGAGANPNLIRDVCRRYLGFELIKQAWPDNG